MKPGFDTAGAEATLPAGARPRGSRSVALLRAIWAEKTVFVSACILVAIVASAALAPWIVSYDPRHVELTRRNLSPAEGLRFDPPHLLGTDQLGRDELARVLSGARVSLTVGLATALGAALLGVSLGLLAGFYRGYVDDIIMRLVDIQMGFPSLLLALLVLYSLGQGVVNLIGVLVVTRWVIFARVTRSTVLSLRETPMVEAARSIGCSEPRIMLRYILPATLSSIITLGPLEAARAVLSEAALSFLGLGVQPPQASWGLMLAQSRQYITSAWWLLVIPGGMISLTTLSLNLLGNWARAVSDPIQRWRWLRLEVPAE